MIMVKFSCVYAAEITSSSAMEVVVWNQVFLVNCKSLFQVKQTETPENSLLQRYSKTWIWSRI